MGTEHLINIANSYKIEIFPEDVHLIRFANQFCTPKYPAPLPLRRTCSIMRSYKFKTLVCESNILEKENLEIDHICNVATCGLRYESCREYINVLDDHYNRKLIKKECFRIAFFNTEFKNAGDIQNLSNENLMAFCIVHRDTTSNYKGKEVQPPYVTESIINVSENRKNSFSIQKYTWRIKIGGKEFTIDGNYFCQQNNITNCCGHAAIKMAIRGFFPGITAEKINKAIGIHHHNRKGHKGFNPREFVTAITKLTDTNARLFEIRSFETPLHFLKLIYHAIESRFPVILLFAYEGEKIEKAVPRSQKLHAATLIGHTFNKNNWWAYAWKGYFSSIQSKLNYLPSVLWCDNFIIQDDNLGPYYLFPLHSLKLSQTLSELPIQIPIGLKNLIQTARVRLSQILSYLKFETASLWAYRPINCIVTYPKEELYFEDVLKIEPFILEYLSEFVMTFLKDSEYEPQNMYYKEYFYQYFERNYLVLRTFSMTSEEYIEKSSDTYPQEMQGGIKKSLRILLPSHIWITEISVPELFWTNLKKLGEIIINPKLFHNRGTRKGSVVFLKLPGFFVFFNEDGKMRPFNFDEKESRHQLIEPACKNCFI